MLKSIFMVTILVLSTGHSERAYQEQLGYQLVEQGSVSEQWSEAWGIEALQGRPYSILQPESGAEVYIRFIETPNTGNYAPMKTLGWNAVELQARDPDTLVAGLDPQRFQLIGPPAFLTGGENIRAAQVLGPARELLYFTHVLDPAKASFNIGTAQSRVDRVFIMVLGTSDLEATSDFYQDVLGQTIMGPYPYRVSVLSRAWGADEETLYDLSIAQLDEAFLLEIDQYPQAAPRRTLSGAGLPFGPAVVSFHVDSLHAVSERLGIAAAPAGWAFVHRPAGANDRRAFG